MNFDIINSLIKKLADLINNIRYSKTSKLKDYYINESSLRKEFSFIPQDA